MKDIGSNLLGVVGAGAAFAIAARVGTDEAIWIAISDVIGSWIWHGPSLAWVFHDIPFVGFIISDVFYAKGKPRARAQPHTYYQVNGSMGAGHGL